MTRRGLISGAAAMAAYRSLGGQTINRNVKLTGDAKVASGIPIPSGPVARWMFSTLALAEGATISTVPDISGHGNPLSIYTGTAAQLPYFTKKTVNGNGGFWPGAAQPNPAMAQTPACAQTGTLVSPNMSLTESSMSVLFCVEGADNGQPAAFGTIFQVGNMVLTWDGGNGNYGKRFLWFNFSAGHGSTNLSTGNPFFNLHAGPVCGALINGFGSNSGQARWMTNRTRATAVGMNLSGAFSLPVFIGDSGTAPFGGIVREVLIYNRTLTEADLDLWNVYCNQRYGTPLSRVGDTSIKHRVVFTGDSVTDGQNAVLAGCAPNVVAQALNNWTKVEYVNYGVGNTATANILTNIANYTGQFDNTGYFAAGQQVAILNGGWFADFSSGNATAEVACYANITTIVADLKAAGFKVAITGMVGGLNYATTNNGAGQQLLAYYNALNTLMEANTAGADLVIGTRAVSQPAGYTNPPTFASFEAYAMATWAGHPDNITYSWWGKLIAQGLLNSGLLA